MSQLTLLTASQPGFCERHGYHHKGNPWKEEHCHSRLGHIHFDQQGTVSSKTVTLHRYSSTSSRCPSHPPLQASGEALDPPRRPIT